MSAPVTDEKDKKDTFLSYDAFVALSHADQFEKIKDLQVWAADMRADQKIKGNSYADSRLYNASAERLSVADLEKIPAGKERSEQAYRYYYACQDALTHGEKILNGAANSAEQTSEASAAPDSEPSAGEAAEESAAAPETPHPGHGQRPRTSGRPGPGQGQRLSPEERLARLTKLQDRVATALADGAASTWTQEQRTAAERFVSRDLAQDFRNNETRKEIRAEFGIVRGALLSGGVGPVDIRVERHRQDAPENTGGGSEPRNGQGGRRERIIERLEGFQGRVRDALSNGTTDGWTHAQQAQAANFANRNLRTEMRDPQSRQDIRAEFGELRQLLRPGSENGQTVDPVQAFSASAHPGWNNRTAGQEPTPPYREVSFKPVAPPQPWSSGFNDQTQIPETQTAAYDVSFSGGPARSAFGPAARGESYSAPASSAPSYGSYDRGYSSEIRWSGGPLRNSFAPSAGYDPGPPSGWRPGMPMSYGRQPGLVENLLGAAATFGLNRARWDHWQDVREGRQDLRQDRRDLWQSRNDPQEFRQNLQELRHDRQELRGDLWSARHPLRDALGLGPS